MIPNWPDLLYVNLGWGRDRARTLGEISESMNAPRRAIEKASEELRRSGVPIISCSAGLYLSTNAREIGDAAQRLRMRAAHQFQGARALRETAKRYAKQSQMNLGLLKVEA